MRKSENAEALMVATWPEPETLARFKNAEAERAIELVCGVVSAVRSTRARYGISPKQELAITVKAPAEVVSTINEQQDAYRLSLARVNVAGFPPKPKSPRHLTPRSSLAARSTATSRAWSISRPNARVFQGTRELEKTLPSLTKLSNPGYLAKAKPEIVEGQGEAREFAAKLELVAQQIAEL